MSRHSYPMRTLVVLTAVALVTIALFAYGSIVLASHQVKSEVDKRVQTTAAVSAVVIGQRSADLLALVHNYASGRSLVADVQGGDSWTPVEAVLDNLTHALPGISASFVASVQGTSLATYPPEPGVIGTNFAYRDWYKGLVATGQPYAANAIVTKEAGNPLAVTFSDYIRAADGTPVGILGINYSLASIAAFSADISNAQGINLTVVDRVGTSLTGTNAHGLIALAGDPRVRAALAGHTSVVEYTPVHPGGGRGPTQLSAYTPVAGTGWAVIASIPTSVAFAGLNQLRATVLAISAAMMILVLIGVRIIVVSDRRRRQSDRQMRSREHELARVLELTDEGFVSIDSTGAITAWNSQAEQLFGWTTGEVLGHNLIDTIIPPAIRTEYRADITRYRPGLVPVHRPQAGDHRPASRRSRDPGGGECVGPRVRRGIQSVRARHLGAGSHRFRPGGGPQRGHAGVAAQERVPGQHEPRDPDPDERGHRDERSPAAHRAGYQTA